MISKLSIVNRQLSIVNRQLSIFNRETFPRAAASFPTSGNGPASRGGFSHFGKRSREPRHPFLNSERIAKTIFFILNFKFEI